MSKSKILIFGGTSFIGRNLVKKLLELDQYELTLFNRGKTNATLFPNIATIQGDRNTDDIQQVQNQDWDYVIDVSCYYPASLEQILKCLSNTVKRYIFVSTCSVYEITETTFNPDSYRDENTLLLDYVETDWTDETPQTYGKRKVACEDILKESGFDYAILRPALVFGRYDYTDRFYYWLHQVQEYDEIMVANEGKQRFSLTYVHDLVDVIIQSISKNTENQIFNVTSFPAITIGEIVETASQILGKVRTLVNATSEFLKENNVNQWADLPLWLDSDWFTFDNKKLVEDLDFQPIDFEQSISDTIDYYSKKDWKTPIYGISREKQKELLNQLKNSQN